ncbi:MAG: heme-binding protein [Salibacteraceae bacterium]
MKWIIITTLVLVALFVAFQVYSMASTKDIESYNYEVLETRERFEIREYESANFSYVTMPNTGYKNVSGQGFRSLAGYIFGGNEKNQSIAMTSPVAMDLDDTVTMMFMLPSEYNIEDLPKPNNSGISFKSEPSKVVAAVRFGGWTSDEKIKHYQQELSDALADAGIEHTGKFQNLGYNPPYEVLNRRNEIIVELVDYSK